MNTTQQFIDHVKVQCKVYGIKLSLRPRKYLAPTKNIRCGGYFDDENRELTVAMKHPEWLPILVHEFAHLTQWVENCEPWRKVGTSIITINDWLGGEEVKGIKKALARSRDLELDNEKRTVKLIKEWNLPIDIKEYTQKANAYIQFYNWMYYSRRWCSVKNSPVRNPAVYKKMPTTFKMDYKKMPEKYKKIYEEAGI